MCGQKEEKEHGAILILASTLQCLRIAALHFAVRKDAAAQMMGQWDAVAAVEFQCDAKLSSLRLEPTCLAVIFELELRRRKLR